MSSHFSFLDGYQCLFVEQGLLQNHSALAQHRGQSRAKGAEPATLSLRSPGTLHSRQMASSEVDGGLNKVSDLKKWTKRDFPGGPGLKLPVAKTELPMQGAQIPSLARELELTPHN